MSGIVGSKLNIRGSGRIAKLGTDGQVLTSAGAGTSAVYEDLAGGISWQSVTTGTTLTAVAGNGYPINTTSNVCTVTLPASASVGDTIVFTDYARTWATYNVTINPNSLNFQGNSSPNPVYGTNGQSVTITYVDATKGWVPTVDDDTTLETPQTKTVAYLCIAGGGAGPDSYGAGGGAGGFRNSYLSETSGRASASETSLALTPSTVYTITIGAGGSATGDGGTSGVDSSIAGSDITNIVSDGGGRGSMNSSNNEVGQSGLDGGSGGGAGSSTDGGGDGGTGTAAQGFDGGSPLGTGSGYAACGGGGSGSVGVNVSHHSANGTNGGLGTTSSITGSAVIRAGGGGGSAYAGTVGYGNGGSGNDGGGGDGVQYNSGSAGNTGDANTGGGAGGGGNVDNPGGSGVIILRMADADYSGTTSGSPTVATGVSGDTVLTFTGTGSYTA
jgi:hypothetical protein